MAIGKFGDKTGGNRPREHCIFSINELTVILKIIDQCENNNVQFEGLDYIIISIAACLIKLDVFKLSDSILKITVKPLLSSQLY